jgi:hypothetical protein
MPRGGRLRIWLPIPADSSFHDDVAAFITIRDSSEQGSATWQVKWWALLRASSLGAGCMLDAVLQFILGVG